MNYSMEMKKVIRSIFILTLMIFPFSGCVRDYVKTESQTGYYYVVKTGDTLSSVAQDHRMSVDELAELNHLDKSFSIKEGLVLFVPRENPTKKLNQVKEDRLGDSQKKKTDQITGKSPGKTGIAKKPDITKKDKTIVSRENVKIRTESKDKITQGEHSKSAITSSKIDGVQKGKFIWPLSGKVISQYGPQANGMFYNGIRIEIKTEASVNASAGGHVIFSALLKDYGETVIIKHESDYATVYTHLTKRLVRVDQIVKRGEKIALVTPLSNGVAFIDFEIRYKNKAKDPLLFLS
jgi:lipoprotein NlpD